MTLKEAIEILGDILHTTCLDRRIPENHAIKLGIEALKKLKAVREGKEWVGINLLPGETED